MGQIHAAQNSAAQTIWPQIRFTNAFIEALNDPLTKWNVVIEVFGFRNDAVNIPYGFMAAQTFADQVLPPKLGVQAPVGPASLLLRFSNRPLNWKTTDELVPNGYAEVRLEKQANIESSVNLAPDVDSGGVLNVGSFVINNQDRYMSEYLADYNFRGRRARLLFGIHRHPRKDYQVALDTYIEETITDETTGESTFTLTDQRFKLDVPFQNRKFSADGTILGGTPDLFNRNLPRCIGSRLHIEPPKIHASGMRMINDGPIYQVDEGYFGGEPAIATTDLPNEIALLDFASQIPEGGYATCLRKGLILPRPALNYSGPFTCKVKGSSAYGWSDRPGDLIVNELSRAGIPSYQISAFSFDFMTGSCGFFADTNDSSSVKEVVEKLALSGGGRLASDLFFTATRLRSPDTLAHDVSFEDEEVSDLQQRGVLSPVVRWELTYGQNDRILTDTEILLPQQNGVLKELLKKPYQIATLEAALTAFRYEKKIPRLVKDTLLNTVEDATALGRQLRDFYSVERQVWTMKLPARAFLLGVGTVVKIKTKREKTFRNGRNCLLVANNRQARDMIHSEVHVIF